MVMSLKIFTLKFVILIKKYTYNILEDIIGILFVVFLTGGLR